MSRVRPPASFYSMEFLEEAELEEEAEGKVKTELELEAEYRHILYGGKKKKAPKLGFGKKKKKPEPPPPTRETKEMKKPQKPGKKGKKGKKKVVKKAPVPEPVASPEPPPPVLPRTRSSGPVPEPPKDPAPEVPSLSWRGKKASGRAYDRTEMRARIKRPFTSAKIEDVTGKYGKEEELVVCGICDQLDPPPEHSSPEETEVEWVGCDCYR